MLTVRTFIVGSIAFIVGLYAGDWLPDVDQDLSIVTHRSVFTHGLIIPLVLFGLASSARALLLRLFVIGFCLGAAVHLSYDLFPRAWQGFALIHLPVFGWTFPAISWVWIAVSIVSCVYFTMRLVSGLFQGIAVLVGGVAMFSYTGLNEATLAGPAASLAVATIIGLAVVMWRSTAASDGSAL